MTAPARPLNAAGKALVILAGMLPAIVTGTISVMLPGISQAFGGGGESSLRITMVATAAGLGMMFGAPIGGYLADRLGRRKVLIAAVTLFAAFGLGAMLVDALWQLIGARFVIGFASGALSVSYIALIADHFDDKSQGKWIGLNAGVATLIVVLLNPVVGGLVDQGWRNGFLVYGLALPILLLVLAGVPRRQASTTTDEPLGAGAILRGIPRPWHVALLATFGGTLAMGTVLYWPFRLRELGVLSARDLSLYYLPNVTVVFAAAMSYGLVRRALGVNQIFALCGTVSALGLAIMAFAPTPLIAAVGLTIEGAAIGLMTPNLSMFAIGIAPLHARARVVGLMKGVFYGSPFLTQFALEAVNGVAGISTTLLTLSGMSAVFAVYMAMEMRRGPVGGTASE